MKNIDLIDILYCELIETEADLENYERIAGKANKELEEKVIQPAIKNGDKSGSLESIIGAASERENRYYFELGFKCAMQLRNVALIQSETQDIC